MQDLVSTTSPLVISETINHQIEKISSLKEALRHVRGIADELRLLGTLSREITLLRELSGILPQPVASPRTF